MKKSIPLLLASALAVTGAARAVGTRYFELSTAEDFTTPESKGVAVAAEGRLREGLSMGALALGDGVVALASTTDARGRLLIGTAPQGKLLRVEGTVVTPLAETGELAVSALVRAGDDIFVGTLPGGKVFRLRGDALEPFVTLDGADHIWALVYDGATKTLFAGTGPDGKILKIDEKGKAAVLLDVDEPHVTALARSSTGRLVAGTTGAHAWVTEVFTDGKSTVLAELAGKEVKALAFAPGGELFALSNDYSDLPEVPKRPPASDRTPAGPVTYPRPKPGRGTLARIDAEGRVEKFLSHGDTNYTALHVRDGSHIFVGTGNDGRIFQVDDAHRSELLADVDERAVMAIDPTPQRGFLVTSDAAFLRRFHAPVDGEAQWTGKVLDAGQRARLGAFSLESKGTVELAFRSGPTSVPDARWSEWGPWLGRRGVPSVPANRFFQARARGFAQGAELSLLRVPFLPDNQRGIVADVTATARGVPTRSKEGLVVPSTEAPKHETVVKLAWRVDNPDGDALRFRIAYRREAESSWRELFDEDSPFTKTEYEWDTAGLVEGRYVVRVEASDELANPPGRARKHSAESEPFAVDNAPPRFLLAAIEGDRLRARVVDAVGPIARLELAGDGRPRWTALEPVDGLFDDADETFSLDLTALGLPPGRHTFALRAYDRAGNAAVVEVIWNP